MSYRLKISFKKVDSAEDVFSALEGYRQHVIDHLEEAADIDHRVYSFIRDNAITKESWEAVRKDSHDTFEMFLKASAWLERFFYQHIFYSKKFGVLGITGVAEVCDDFFDKVIFFQNSADQDYPRGDWEGIEGMEKIYDEAMKMTKEELSKADMFWHDIDSEEELDYYRRTYAYQEIFKEFEDAINSEHSTGY